MKTALTFAAALAALFLASSNASAGESCENTCYVTYNVEKIQGTPIRFNVAISLQTSQMDESQYMTTAYNLLEQNVNNFAIRTARRVCIMSNAGRLPPCDKVVFEIQDALEGYGEQDCAGL